MYINQYWTVPKQRGISHWLGSGLGSDSKPGLSRATSVNILQLQACTENLSSTLFTLNAQLRLGSDSAQGFQLFSELSPEPSQCDMPQSACYVAQNYIVQLMCYSIIPYPHLYFS